MNTITSGKSRIMATGSEICVHALTASTEVGGVSIGASV